GRLDLLRLDDLRQCRQTRVRHLDDADVRLDGAEGVVGRFDTGLGQRIEKGGLADVGQADDAAFEAHELGSSLFFAGLGRVLSRVVAAVQLPLTSSGQADSARSMAASISSRSSRRGGLSTNFTTSLRSPGWPIPMRRRQ